MTATGRRAARTRTPPAPTLSRRYSFTDLDALDDEALSLFTQPGEAGVDPRVLGLAAQGEVELARRLERAIPESARPEFAAALAGPGSRSAVAAARRSVVQTLFWVLLYWHAPTAYEELVAGEAIHPRILEHIQLDRRDVCDLGAGAGRMTFHAARLARHVVAVDAVPPLLRLLDTRLREIGAGNVEVRRGSFTTIPLPDSSVDIVVACSSMTSRTPWGGETALQEMRRVVRDGGDIAIVWPDRPDWFRDRGFLHISASGNDQVRFASPASAQRIARDFYSPAAAARVAEEGCSEVPFATLGVPPPNDLCIATVRKPAPAADADSVS